MRTLAKTTETPHDEHRDIDVLVDSVLAESPGAWQELVASIHPMAIRLCQQRLHTKTVARDDITRDVATRTLERLQKNEFAALQRYVQTCQTYPDLNFVSWLRVVVGNLLIDHLRGLPEQQRVREGALRQHRTSQNVSLGAEHAGHSDLRRHVEVRRILAWLAEPEFPDDQRRALALWLRGYSAGEIAESLHLSSGADATRLLRAGRQRLRRHFESQS